MSATHCPTCGEHWDDHEFGVPAPLCPRAPMTVETPCDRYETAEALVVALSAPQLRQARLLAVRHDGAHMTPITHRPSYTSPEHTACGLKLDQTTHLQLGDGETCERCTHVVRQVAAVRNGEPSWAARMP